MDINIAKLFLIQSHDWGGMLYLRKNNAMQLEANQADKNNFKSDVVKDPDYFVPFIFALLPVSSSDRPGAYYLVGCSFTDTATRPAVPVQPAAPVLPQPVPTAPYPPMRCARRR